MDFLTTLIPFGIMFGMMYFLLIRPQKQQQEKVQNMLDSLQVGDSVVTIGGLHGVIDEINDDVQTVVLDCEGIYLTFERRSISRVVSKATNMITNTDDFGVEDSTTDSTSTEE